MKNLAVCLKKWKNMKILKLWKNQILYKEYILIIFKNKIMINIFFFKYKYFENYNSIFVNDKNSSINTLILFNENN